MASRALPRPAAARAKRAQRRRAQQEAKRAASAKARAQRAAAREKRGRLRDQVISARTLKLYRAATAEFYRWCRREGIKTPQDVVTFDSIVSQWAEALYQEGDMKCVLNRGLCGLAHLVPALRGRLPGSWRLYHAWSKTDERRQAPPIELLLAQAFAGYFVAAGEAGAALCILAAHDCILRNSEFYELRTGDLVAPKQGLLLSLRDTKMGQRLGVTQQVLCKNKWLVGRLRRWASTLARGETIMQCSQVRFRWVWAQARKELRVAERYTPYGLRRGGATSCFRETGSFDRVCDRGRWGIVSACRIYVTTSLQAAAMEDYAGHHSLWQRWASKLWQLPA